MRKSSVVVLLVFLLVVLFIGRGVFGLTEDKMKNNSEFEKIFKETPIKEGVKIITYDQFMKLRNSGQEYLLFDVLSSESYNEGHIEGAVSFSFDTINKDTAETKIGKGLGAVVYCASFKCHASTEAAARLSKLGYKVLDYKGGLKEWQEKGNKLIK